MVYPAEENQRIKQKFGGARETELTAHVIVLDFGSTFIENLP